MKFLEKAIYPYTYIFLTHISLFNLLNNVEQIIICSIDKALRLRARKEFAVYTKSSTERIFSLVLPGHPPEV